MTIINSLSSSLGQKGNEENIANAKGIVKAKNHEAIKELADNLDNTEHKHNRYDQFEKQNN